MVKAALFPRVRLPSRSLRRSAMPLSGCAGSASPETRSSRPTSLATRMRSWLPTFSSSSLTTRMTSLLLLVDNEKGFLWHAHTIWLMRTQLRMANPRRSRRQKSRRPIIRIHRRRGQAAEPVLIPLARISSDTHRRRLEAARERTLTDNSEFLQDGTRTAGTPTHTGSRRLVVVLGR